MDIKRIGNGRFFFFLTRLINSLKTVLFSWVNVQHVCRHGPGTHSQCRTGLFSSASAWRKFWTFFCAQAVCENRKVPQDFSAVAFSVLCLCWKILSATLEICVLRLDKEVVKLRGFYLLENTMWSSCVLGPFGSPDVFNRTGEVIEKVLGVLLMKCFFYFF